jgi:hypothetical protein
MEISIEQRHGLPLLTLVARFVLPQERLNLLCEETA